MPMPDTGSEWPPAVFHPAFHTIATHKALYRGPQPPDLTRGAGWESPRRTGGLVGAVSDLLWGKVRNTPIERPERHHVPLASDLASLSADLLFSEAPRILPLAEDEEKVPAAIKDRVDTVINNARNHSKFLEAAEIAAALCGVYLRIVWDEDVADYPILDVVYPDQAVPTWRWGKLTEVTFWSVLEEDHGRIYRHLEHHSPGRIDHALYRGEKDNLGQLIPLEDHEGTAWLAEMVDADGGIITGSDHLTAAYIPNALPSRHYGDDPDLSPFGRSDFEGVEQMFLDLDDAYTSWMRDIRLAKSRLFVDATAMHDLGPGKGQHFDEDHEVYTPLQGFGSMNDARQMVQAQQFNIRYVEHRETITQILHQILRSTGYSPSTLGEQTEGGAMTAKEVRNRERASKRTWTKKQRHWESALKPLCETLLEVDAHVFGSPINGRVNLEFKISNSLDGDVVDLASTISVLNAADAISLDQMLRMMYPNWSRKQLNEEADKIRAERPWLQGVEDPEVSGRVGDEEEARRPANGPISRRLSNGSTAD